jgi:hypothetical protein
MKHAFWGTVVSNWRENPGEKHSTAAQPRSTQISALL